MSLKRKALNLNAKKADGVFPSAIFLLFGV